MSPQKEEDQNSPVELSKINVQIYDLLGLLIPGLALLALIAFTILGWDEFLAAVQSLNGPMITAVLMAGFALGHLVQQLSDWAARRVTHERFFKQWRDRVWTGPDGDLLRTAIQADGGSINSVDAAFNFTLSKVKIVFEKRDTFVATADFCRVMAAISVLGLSAVARSVHDHWDCRRLAITWAVSGVLMAAIFAVLFWQRMLRFKDHAETPVFQAYLAQRSDNKQTLHTKE